MKAKRSPHNIGGRARSWRCVLQSLSRLAASLWILSASWSEPVAAQSFAASMDESSDGAMNQPSRVPTSLVEGTAAGQPPKDAPVTPAAGSVPVIEVLEQRQPLLGASEGKITQARIELLPLTESEALLQHVPGIQLSKHGGEGKAAQFFLRGFDAVHGAELAVSLEGVPLNEVSNVHGQGYLDLHFLPHRMVEGLHYLKGIPGLEVGDFAVGGAANYELRQGVEQRHFSAYLATEGAAGIQLAARPFERLTHSFLWLELEGAGGPLRLPQRAYRALRLGLGGTAHQAGVNTRFFVLAYDGVFESPGVLRLDALQAGSYSLYDSMGFDQGGHSQRLLAALIRKRQLGGGELTGLLWAGARGLELRHNFTGYYLNGANSDTRAQFQHTLQAGSRLTVELPFRLTQSLQGQLSAGAAGRVDGMQQREVFLLPTGQEYGVTYAAIGQQTELGVWAESLFRRERVQLSAGVRFERLDFWRQPTDETPELPTISAEPVRAWGSVGQPRLSLRVPVPGTSMPVLLAGARRGFRAPELRSLAGGVAPIPVADSAELGVWQGLAERGEARLLFFGTWISDELVFDHTAGRLLSTGSTRRLGGEANLTYRLSPVELSFELSYADGRYQVTGEPLPFAPRWLSAFDVRIPRLTLSRWPAWAGEVPQLRAGLRTFVLGRRPLPDGFASQPASSTSLKLDLMRTRQSLSLEVENLFFQENFDGEFVYSSQFDPLQPRSELPAVHVTAGTPFSLRLTLEQFF